MTVLKRPAAVAAALAAAVLTTVTLTTGALAGTSAATPTWTITKGGAVAATAKTITFTDTTQKLTSSCGATSLKARLKSGTKLSGTNAGTVTSVSKISCSLAGYTAKITAGHLPWHLNLVSYNSKTGVTRATLTGIHLAVTVSALGVTCSGIIDGTGGSAHNGRVKATYTNKTGKLALLAAGGNLHVYNVSNCFGVVSDGDAVTLSTTYTIAPKQHITSP